MRDQDQVTRLRQIVKVFLAALVLGAAFLLPQAVHALTFPTTPCDGKQDNYTIVGVNQGLSSQMVFEDGTHSFSYGNNSQNFVTAAGTQLTFRFNLLFTPGPNAMIKLVAFDPQCNGVGGFGPLFNQLNPIREHTMVYDQNTSEVSMDGQTQTIRPSGVIRYIWAQVWDGENYNLTASYSYLVDITNLQNPTGSPPPIPPLEPPGPRPVLIIPGILGSELYNDTDLIWPDVTQMTFSLSDNFMLNNLQMDANGNSVESITTGDIVKKVLTVDSFKSLIDSFNSNAYNANQTYFLFPYDWRMNLDSKTSLLNHTIEQIKIRTGFSKIDIIAHSMGGLLTEDYINQYGKDSIDKLIFVGTPHLGAPKAAKTLMHGDNLNIPVLNSGTMKKLAENMSSIYELLPNQTYFGQTNGYIVTSPDTNAPRLNFNNSKQFILDHGGNSGLFTQAENFFSKNLEHTDWTGIDAYNIAGCWVGTQAVYDYRDPNDSSLALIEYTNGDGTVPLVSADHLNLASSKKYYVKSVKHSELPSADGVRQLILGILSDSTGSLANNVTQNINDCDLQGVSLVWRSPVTVHVYDNHNNHLGPASNDAIDANIPGADYEIIDGEKFVFLPTTNGQTYTIQGVGEANATFDLLISKINNGQVMGTKVFNDVGITNGGSVKFKVNNNNTNDAIVVNGKTVSASSSLTPAQSADLIAPTTEAQESPGTRGSKKITLTAIDDNSGVLLTKYSLTGKEYRTYSGPITLNARGVTTIYFYSVDRAGNNEQIQTVSVTLNPEARLKE